MSVDVSTFFHVNVETSPQASEGAARRYRLISTGIHPLYKKIISSLKHRVRNKMCRLQESNLNILYQHKVSSLRPKPKFQYRVPNRAPGITRHSFLLTRRAQLLTCLRASEGAENGYLPTGRRRRPSC